WTSRRRGGPGPPKRRVRQSKADQLRSLSPPDDIVTATANLGQELLIGCIHQSEVHQPHRPRILRSLRIAPLHDGHFLRGCLPVGPLDDAIFRAHERIARRAAVCEEIRTPVDIAVTRLGRDLAHESLLLVDEEAAHSDTIDSHFGSSLRGETDLDSTSLTHQL